MAALPQTLDRKHHVDLKRRHFEPRIRFTLLLLLAAVSAAGLADVFGQRPTTTAAESDAAALTLRAPDALRGGLIYEVKLQIDARRALEKPRLVFDPGWFDGLTINTFQPEPVDWAQRDGRNVLVYTPIPAGGRLVVRLQYQVNPTAVGRRTQNVALDDGDERLLDLRHAATIFP